MEKRDAIIAALAAAGGAEHSPVQVQKLFFLLDKQVPKLGGPFFEFEPYDYGPFDRAVYDALQNEAGEFVEIAVNDDLRRRKYRLTPAGQAHGEKLLATLPSEVAKYIRELSEWVRSMSFGQLVSSIYRAYPEMKANSIFQE